jgi:hypothetical protein
MYAENLCGWEMYADQARPHATAEIRDRIFAIDASLPVESPQKYDLVMSVEVAEHINPEGSDTFCRNLINACAHRILLTAAPPGQPGTGHINCRKHDYWIETLGSFGAKYNAEDTDTARRCLGEDLLKLGKNLMVFRCT